ncbi:MAG: hypothetical protein HYR96_08555 [Deltaproteobacteria bacterium]|nr:hypothetical protein [Deltaproteobacteria bacterium]MBI3294662.1 hypothetical protein [Deltaproteobacteria bacterium]
MRTYLFLWLAVLLALSLEYFALNTQPELSSLKKLGFTPEPGRALSLYLGWAGMGLMALMNVYSLRKRFRIAPHARLSRVLDFHIFCGLLGPTLIIFHSNFKVRGLVAISFWSMIVAALSGVVGRYIYVQVLRQRRESEKESEQWSQRLNELCARATGPVSADLMNRMKGRALKFVGLDPKMRNPFLVFVSALFGDVRLLFDSPAIPAGVPTACRSVLKNYALAERQSKFLEPFQKLMGYWHSFHTPFAFFMYLAATIHIAAALILGVNR